ncbi:MAG: hypothetical protein LBJ89_03130 [Holosporales bacterium]|nr:hypothetical protein [Holosporales bacterium]
MKYRHSNRSSILFSALFCSCISINSADDAGYENIVEPIQDSGTDVEGTQGVNEQATCNPQQTLDDQVITNLTDDAISLILNDLQNIFRVKNMPEVQDFMNLDKKIKIAKIKEKEEYGVLALLENLKGKYTVGQDKLTWKQLKQEITNAIDFAYNGKIQGNSVFNTLSKYIGRLDWYSSTHNYSSVSPEGNALLEYGTGTLVQWDNMPPNLKGRLVLSAAHVFDVNVFMTSSLEFSRIFKLEEVQSIDLGHVESSLNSVTYPSKNQGVDGAADENIQQPRTNSSTCKKITVCKTCKKHTDGPLNLTGSSNAPKKKVFFKREQTSFSPPPLEAGRNPVESVYFLKYDNGLIGDIAIFVLEKQEKDENNKPLDGINISAFWKKFENNPTSSSPDASCSHSSSADESKRCFAIGYGRTCFNTSNAGLRLLIGGYVKKKVQDINVDTSTNIIDPMSYRISDTGTIIGPGDSGSLAINSNTGVAIGIFCGIQATFGPKAWFDIVAKDVLKHEPTTVSVKRPRSASAGSKEIDQHNVRLSLPVTE